MKDLMPCPFCGGSNIEVRVRKTAIIECDDCGALFIKRTEAAAIGAWNTRFFMGVKNVSSEEYASKKPDKPED